jgi:hypothetical protein
MTGAKQYLGDSVYANFDGFYLILTVENGNGPPGHEIFIEPQVWDALVAYRQRIQEAIRRMHAMEGVTG